MSTYYIVLIVACTYDLIIGVSRRLDPATNTESYYYGELHTCAVLYGC